MGLDGSASWSLSGSAALSMVVPFGGAGSVALVSHEGRRKLNGGKSCAIAVMMSNSIDSSAKRHQLMLTSQLP